MYIFQCKLPIFLKPKKGTLNPPNIQLYNAVTLVYFVSFMPLPFKFQVHKGVFSCTWTVILELEKEQQPGVKLCKVGIFLSEVPLVIHITFQLLKWKEYSKKEGNITQKM